MRQLQTLLLCGLLLAAALPAGAQGIRIAGPAIELIPPEIDFGILPQQTIRYTSVVLRNSGTELLIIRDVESDCGCAVAELSDSTIAPGESATMEVTLSTRNFTSEITKHVIVKTNDPGAPQARFRIRAFVRELVLVRPGEVDFGDVPRGATPHRNVRITAALHDSLEIRAIAAPQETFVTRLERSVFGDSTLYELEIGIRPDAPLGPIAAKVGFETSIKKGRNITLHLKGQVHGFFKCEPSQLIMGQVRQGNVRQRAVRLVAQTPGSYRVLGATCTGEFLGVQVATIEPGRVYEVTVTIPADAPAGRIHGLLRIETDDPEQPEIIVPVRGTVRHARPRGGS